jgi:hypothetical protein
MPFEQVTLDAWLSHCSIGDTCSQEKFYFYSSSHHELLVSTSKQKGENHSMLQIHDNKVYMH